MVVLSPLSLFTSNQLVPSNMFLREQARTVMQQNKWQPCSSAISKPTLQSGFCRRELLLFGLSAPVLVVLPSSGSLAEEDLKMATFVDEINSCSYLYPVELPSKKVIFKWVESRKPERYSSAAPLSPDARLRIVSERVDIVDNLIISISIGPPNSKIIKSLDKSTWTAKDVADSVLADKSALRVTSSQRMAESSVLDAHSGEIAGEPYWYYEYLVRKAPTKTAEESNNYRHYVASTTERDGYLYSINASTLNKQWNIVGPILQKTIASFHLLPPTENYVPPYKDPWRFW
ncbi:PREDICTED: psbP domain-containing 5 chloroplastic [Prunus dulcis]|uniref:PREDICTED: psbP domain-containing 5 chloroplastic n=1 Tax=Prunus dulcis TaxID=3755 RepID=A0A5E4EJ54_PRUDU|nr:psbP domain-containing protein 5, chloroplastic isoform X1 [Prunus dulcis]VVA15020.1 PREDICTED: psbP domain-containing 5 chloroplastic [Prunus dulcis]